MTIYRTGKTVFHSLDPYTKFLWVLMLSVWLMSMIRIVDVAVASMLIFLASTTMARLPYKRFAKSALLLALGGVWLVLFQGWIRPGEGFEVVGIHFSQNGIEVGIAIILRTVGLVSSSLAFATTTKPQEMITSLVQLGVPYKLAHVAYLALRFIPLFQRDLGIINDVQTLRGVTKRRQRYLLALIAMIATQMQRVDDTAIALETRGFGLYETQTALDRVEVTRKGGLLLVATVVVIALHTIFL